MSIQLFWQLLITVGCLFNQGQGANAHEAAAILTLLPLLRQELHGTCPSPWAGVVEFWAFSDARFVGRETRAGCPLLHRSFLCQLRHCSGSSWNRLLLASRWKELYLVLRQAFPPGSPGELRAATRHGLLGQNFSGSPHLNPCPLASAVAGLALSPSASTSPVLHYSMDSSHPC